MVRRPPRATRTDPPFPYPTRFRADWQRFDRHVSGGQRVNAVLDWMRRSAEIRPVFVTLYFDIVDTAGHRFGPDSVEVNEAIGKVDESIGELIADLAAEIGRAHV